MRNPLNGPFPHISAVSAISSVPAGGASEFSGLRCVFVNGFNIGRYWNVGPQGTLFVPAPMLRRGANEIVIFDAAGCDDPVIEFRNHPELDRRL